MEEQNKEEIAFVAWLNGESDTPVNQEVQDNNHFKALKETWELTGTAHAYKASSKDSAWKALASRIEKEENKNKTVKLGWIRYAAAVAALLAVVSILYFNAQTPTGSIGKQSSEIIAIKHVTTPSNQANFQTLQLPDGSTVKLNAGSSISYPEHFAGNNRKVKLSGEAYFDVVHDANHPFLVEVNNLEVLDLGTAFNISAYPTHTSIEINVTHGTVMLRDTLQKSGSILAAGTRGNYIRKSGEVIVSKELAPNFMSWITRQVVFHRTPLSEVFQELEEIYHVQIHFSDPQIASIAYTANFDKFELEDIVNIIARTHNLAVKKVADSYVFASK